MAKNKRAKRAERAKPVIAGKGREYEAQKAANFMSPSPSPSFVIFLAAKKSSTAKKEERRAMAKSFFRIRRIASMRTVPVIVKMSGSLCFFKSVKTAGIAKIKKMSVNTAGIFQKRGFSNHWRKDFAD